MKSFANSDILLSCDPDGHFILVFHLFTESASPAAGLSV